MLPSQQQATPSAQQPESDDGLPIWYTFFFSIPELLLAALVRPLMANESSLSIFSVTAYVLNIMLLCRYRIYDNTAVG